MRATVRAAREGGAGVDSNREADNSDTKGNFDERRAASSSAAGASSAAVVDEAALTTASAAGDDVFLCEYTYDSHFQRFKRRLEWENDDLSDDEGWQGFHSTSGPAAARRGGDGNDNDEDEDEDEDHLDTEYTDGGEEWGAKQRGGGKKTGKASRRDTRGRGLVISRHITANRRAAAAASGDAGVMGIGAMTVQRVEKPAPLTALGRARQALSLAANPGRLPCREQEREKIFSFVEQSINAGGSCLGRLPGVLYISGVPGTGKTATVREVVRSLRAKSRAGFLPRFNHVELNGLKLQSPAHAYSAIAEELMGVRMSPKHANEELDRRFKEGKGSDGRVTVLVVDEMDLLVTRTQQLLYNLFEWPTHHASRLVILGIANTLDLPERLLPKILSRLGANRVTFQPYTADQLKKIVYARLADAGIEIATGARESFESTAIEMASRKVAAVSGDARRVLELCRRGAELAEARIAARKAAEEKSKEDGKAAGLETGAEASAGDVFFGARSSAAGVIGARPRVPLRSPDSVTMKDIQTAQGEMFQTPFIRLLEAASRHERIFLAALIMEMRRSGKSEADTTNVMRTHEQLCRVHGEAMPPAGSGPSIACRLASQRLLLADPGRKRSAQRVSLNVPVEDVVYALKETRVERAAAAAAAAKARAGGGHAVDAGSAETCGIGEAGLDHGDIPWLRTLPGL